MVNSINIFFLICRNSWLDTLTPDNMVFGLIIANTAIFLLWRIADEKFMINNFTVSFLINKLGDASCKYYFPAIALYVNPICVAGASKTNTVLEILHCDSVIYIITVFDGVSVPLSYFC